MALKTRLTTAKQKSAIAKAIQDHHLAFCAEVLGPDSIPPEDYKRLSKAGLITKSAIPVADATTAAVVIGALELEGDPVAVAAMKPDNFWSSVLTPTHLKSLTSVEKEAIDVARDTAALLIKGLGNRIDHKTGQVLVEADTKLRKRLQTTVKRSVIRGIAERQTTSQVATQLKSITKDATTDWLKISATEIHNSMEEGRANHIAKSVPAGGDTLVFKRPRTNACPYCKVLFLKSDNVTPRVFYLSDIAANGTNHLRKARRPTLTGATATEWQPVVGAVHPWCRCTIHQLPDGFAFDSSGNMQYMGVKKSEELIEVEVLNPDLLNHKCIHHDH